MSKLTRFKEIAPWRPFGVIDNRLRALFDELNEEFLPVPSEARAWIPAVELVESDDELLLTAELPGMVEDDVEIEIEDNMLMLRGEKSEELKEEKEEKKVRYHVWERAYGKFQRSFVLPGNVDEKKISAEFENGVLKVHMPKTAESKARRIKIAKR